MIVDHRNPIHDSYCRCRSCKPALRNHDGPTLRVQIAATLLAVIIFASLFR